MERTLISHKTLKLIDGYRIEFKIYKDPESYPAVTGIATLYQGSDIRNIVERMYMPRTNADLIDARQDMAELVTVGVGYECEDMSHLI